ncbi:hypothetical protein AB0E21_05020 [Streptomyces sp. NPDC047967]|uniref:hypothetical protein n=1 Tax=Streptomyces sp. NPDC047967 TaxID=3154924 RepID=UPI0034116D66
MILQRVLGPCWLGCGNDFGWTRWFGPVRTAAGDGDMYACDDCIARVERMVVEQLARRDASDLNARYTSNREYV